jgi:cyanophycin synthetase
MNQTLEPKVKKSKCPYCGDAQISHRLSYIESLIANNVDAHMTNAMGHVPSFIKKFVDWFLIIIFKILCFLRLARLSQDMDKATSFRSRVIWEEAKKRDIKMEQVVLFGKYMDIYKANLNGKTIYFESLPIQPQFLDLKKNWDDKVLLKKELIKNNIPVPFYAELSFSKYKNLDKIFKNMPVPVIVKPRLGSRARHTVTNITNLEQFKEGVGIANKISAYLVVEEHLEGYVCRATVVGGKLAGFYRGRSPSVEGDGVRTILELIEEKDAERQNRVEKVRIDEELHKYLSRQGFEINDVPPIGKNIFLSHRIGRLFGGTTKEMVEEIHPSFIPFLEKAGEVTGLSVAGFDVIIPDPTKDAYSQKWGIIECNTLPFIDLHYYALVGKPRNIAGMVWDLWGN